MQGGRREVPAFVALATVWLMVQGVVGAATSGNTLRTTSHLTLDQYSPLPLYHHGLELYGRRNNGNSQLEDEHRVNRKVDDDFLAYRSTNDRRRDSSISSISTNDFPIVEKSYDLTIVGSKNPREQSPRIVPSETMIPNGWRSKNFAGSKEFGKEGVDYAAAAPPNEMDESFVADETFQDEGPGSVEIYKLDLFEEKKVPASGAGSVKVPESVRTLTVAPVTTRTTTGNNNNNNNNKSKVPKKSSRLSWKLGKSTSGGGVIKSITSDATRPTTRVAITTDGKDGKDLLYGRSSFWESELRSEAPPNGDAFGVGGVPELQVGCEGLEASSSSYYSRKLRRRSIIERKNETKENDPTVELDIVPISLNLDYDWSKGSDEEMDELLKLKKLESEASKRKENRGDMDPLLDDFFNQENERKEKLPIRGDLGNVSEKSLKRLGDLGLKRGRRNVDESVSSDSSGSVSSLRKLLWTENSKGDSDLWGYGEDEGALPDDGLNSEERRRHREEHKRRGGARGRNEHGGDVANTEIDMIREEYERWLEKERREERERLRRLKELQARRSSMSNDRREEEEERRRLYEERMRMEELRRREEAGKRAKEEEEELRRRNPDVSRRNFTMEDRRSYEERRWEWEAKRRQEEERRRQEVERRRQEEERNVPSNLMRSGYPHDRRNESRTREEERMRLERERKLREDMERQANRQRYGDDDSERRRMEDERRRYGQEGSGKNETREEAFRRRVALYVRGRVERRKEEERRRLEEASKNSNVTRDSIDEDYQRRLREHRRKLEEDQRRMEEERRLQEYVRRNQPIDLRTGQRRDEWNASRRREEEEEQQRRAIEAVGQLNRSRYPSLSSERRQHGPWAPTYIDPRAASLDESRRRQQMEASLQRQRQDEERRREEEYRRQQSRRYEEERKRMEERRREEERRRQYAMEEQRRREATASTARDRQVPWSRTRQTFHDRPSQRSRQDTASLVPANLYRDERRRNMERERNKQEEERRRQQALVRDNERRREEEARLRAQRERQTYIRNLEAQRKRQEEARLNALPVNARIIVRGQATPTHSWPSTESRSGFGNEIDFSTTSSPGTRKTLVESPNACVWAVVQCCPTKTRRLVTCFESLGCPSVNWTPNVCADTIVNAARVRVEKFYAALEEEDRY